MAAIYLKHPVHGYKVASGTAEADYDRSNGWVILPGPPAPKSVLVVDSAPVEVPVALPSFFAPAGTPLPEGFPVRDLLVKAGYATMESVPRDKDALIGISGVGIATALKVLDALEG